MHLLGPKRLWALASALKKTECPQNQSIIRQEKEKAGQTNKQKDGRTIERKSVIKNNTFNLIVEDDNKVNTVILKDILKR